MKNNKLEFFKNIDFRSFLKFVAAANFIIFFLYKFIAKSFALESIAAKQEPLDVNYYSAIFSYLDYSALIVAVLSLLAVLFFNKIKSFLDDIAESDGALFVLLALNASLQLCAVLLIGTEQISDGYYYVKIAEEFLRTGVYSNGVADFQSAYWPVGAPALVVGIKYLFGGSLFFVKILNILFSSLLIFAVYKIFGRELTRKGAFYFLLLYVFFPTNFLSANVVMTELPFTAALWISVYFVMKKNIAIKDLILSGLFLGLAAYFRGTALPISVLFAFYFIKRFDLKKGLKYGALIAAFQLTLLSPWIYRNYKLFDAFVPATTNAGFNFLMGNCADSKGKNDFSAEYDFFNPNELQEQKNAFERGLKDIAGNPLKTVLREPMKLFFSYYRGDYSVTWALKNTENEIHPLIKSLLFYLSNMWFYATLFFSFLYLIFYRKIFDDSAANLLLILFYLFFIAVILVFVGSERYIVPLYPIHFFLFAKYFQEKRKLSESSIIPKSS